MKRTMLVVLLLAAAVFALQPILHQHSLVPVPESEHGVLSPTATILCSLCAIGADRVVVGTPAVAAPLVVAFLLATILIAAPSRDAQLVLSSRAPPAR